MVDKETQTAAGEPTFHPAVELLLARMKSNPDEFAPKGYRWNKLVESNAHNFTEEEHVAMNAGRREIAMNAFHVAVMNELLREPGEEKDVIIPTITNGYYTTGANVAIGTTGAGGGVMTAHQTQGYNDLMRSQYPNAYPQPVPATTNGLPPPKRWGLF